MLGWPCLCLCAANTPASAVYSDPADAPATPMGQTLSGNVLANANVPSGTSAAVTGFSVEGSTQVLAPGTTVTLSSPVTGLPTGKLTLQASGAYTFVPEPGYMGPAPAINVYSRDASLGQAAVSSLTIDVIKREHGTPVVCSSTHGCYAHTRACVLLDAVLRCT
jgi:hypothetical protein